MNTLDVINNNAFFRNSCRNKIDSEADIKINEL